MNSQKNAAIESNESIFKRLIGSPLTRWALVFGLLIGTLVVLTPRAEARGPMGRNFGLGVALGNPLSFTGKYHLSDNDAIDFHIGKYHAYGSRLWRSSLFLGGDYLFTLWNFLETDAVSIPFYAGPGLGLAFDTRSDRHCYRDGRGYYCDGYEFGFGPRLPVGVMLQFEKAPFELGLEMAPSMMILVRDNPYGDNVHVQFDVINFALLARFYFG